MDVKIGMVLLALCCFKYAHGVSNVGHSEIDELRAMLMESRDQNRRMEQQISRLKLVWTGLQKMCEVLSPQCMCEDNSSMSSTTKRPSQTGRVLKILSATSSGNETGDVVLSVTYTASATHSTDWVLQYDRVGGEANLVRTTGNTSSIGDREYRNTIVARRHQLMALGFSVYSENETATVTFTEKFGKRSFQTVPEPKPAIIQVDIRNNENSSTDEKEITSPVSQLNASDFTALVNVEFIFNKTYAELSQMPDVSVSHISLKKTNDTPSQYELYSAFYGADGNIDLSTHSMTRTTSKYIVTLKPPLTERGGMFTVNFPLEAFGLEDIQQDLISQITYGYAIPIRTELIPENTVALIDITEKTLMTAPVHTLTCVAMGNPSPKVQMFRELADGRRRTLAAEVASFGEWIRGAYYTLEASDRKAPGTYICRAESGTAVAEERTEVVVYEAVTFDDARTGVIKNNSKKVVFGCKVRGSEKPRLEFRLYDEYGPNIALMDKFVKVSESKSGKTTSRIQLTISPPNPDIHTVYCVSRLHGIEEFRKLELFPGTYPSWNDSLYDQSRNSTDPYNGDATYPYFNMINATYPSYNVSFP